MKHNPQPGCALHSTYDSFLLYDSPPFFHYQSSPKNTALDNLNTALNKFSTALDWYLSNLHSSITNLHICLQTVTHRHSLLSFMTHLLTNLHFLIINPHSCLIIFPKIVVSLSKCQALSRV